MTATRQLPTELLGVSNQRRCDIGKQYVNFKWFDNFHLYCLLADVAWQPAGIVNNEAHAMHVAVTDKTMRKRAAALGRTIRAEDGVGNAVKIFSQMR